MMSAAHTVIFTFFQGFLRLVQAPRVYPRGCLCVVAERKTQINKQTEMASKTQGDFDM